MRSVLRYSSVLLFWMGLTAAADGKLPIEFLDLSPCHADSDFHPACRWVSGRFKPWPEELSLQVRDDLNLDYQLNPRQRDKLESFYNQLRQVGLEKIQFVYSDDGGTGDQAETTMNGHVAIVVLRPALFSSQARFGLITERRHALLHELFHVLINLTVGSETPSEPFWKGLAHALEWRNTHGSNSLIDARLRKEVFNRSRELRARGEWSRAVEADLKFSRSVGFPSIYGMSRLSEYVPELGAFLIHDATMAAALPPSVWDVVRQSPLGFLLQGESRPPSLSSANGRREAAKIEDQFVGLLFDQSKFVCTVFVLRHGLVVTSKSCLDPAWPMGGHPGVRYSFLTLEFPRVADDGPPIRVDGMQITGILPDSGANDFAYLTYDGKLTEGRLELPELKLVRNAQEFTEISRAQLFTLGFAMPAKPQRLVRLKSEACHARGAPQATGPGANGAVISSDCPGWTGSMGLPILSEGPKRGQFNVWGIVSRQLTEKAAEAEPTRQDGWGRFTEVGFSPAYLLQDI